MIMKRIYTLLASVLATVAAVSCNVLEQDNAPKGKPIAFTASVGGYTVKATDTAFDQGDRVGLYAMSPLNYFDEALRFDGNALVPEKELYWNDDSTQGVLFYAYYPYESGFVPTRSSLFEVKQDQSNYADYTASDLMATSTWATPEEESVHFVFNHMLSKIIVTIDNVLGVPVTDVYLENVGTSAHVNVNKDECLIASSGRTIRLCPVAIDGREAWIGILPPQNITPEIRVYTEDGKDYLFSAESMVRFLKGFSTGAFITLDGLSPLASFSSEIIDWNWGGEYTFRNINDNRKASIYVLDESGHEDATLFVETFDNSGSSNNWLNFKPIETVYSGNYAYQKYDISQCIGLYLCVAFPVYTMGERYFGGWMIEADREIFLYRSPVAQCWIDNPQAPYDNIYLDSVTVEGWQLSYFAANPFQRYEMTGQVFSNAVDGATAASYYINTADGNTFRIADISSPDGDLSFIDSGKQVRISFILSNDNDGSKVLAQVQFLEYIEEADERQFSWSIVGEMNNWGGDSEIWMDWSDQHNAFIGYIENYAGEQFKIRANGTWDYNYGGPWTDNSSYYLVNIPNGSMGIKALRDGANITVDIKSFPNFSGKLFVMYYPNDKYLEVGDASFLAGSTTPTTVEEALLAEDGTFVDIQPGIVVATCARGFVIMDEVEASVLVYQGANPSMTVSVGDVVRVQGTKTTYSNTAEIQGDLVIEIIGTVADLTQGEVTPDTLIDFLADYPGFQNITKVIDQWEVPYAAPVEVTGVLRNGCIMVVDGSDRKVNFYWPDQDYSYAFDHEVTIRGFAVNYNASAISVMVSTLEVGEEVAPIEIIDISIAELLKVQPSSTQRYRVTGVVDEIANSTYGNLYLADETGLRVYIYGLTSSDLGYGATNDKSFSRLGIEVGQTITVVGYPALYKDAFELVYAYPEEY